MNKQNKTRITLHVKLCKKSLHFVRNSFIIIIIKFIGNINTNKE
jgi:hypothetical protein